MRASRVQWLTLWVMATVLATQAPSAGSEDELGRVLAGLERASSLYLDSSLRFACDETISASRKAKTQRFSYIFIYDRQQGFQDYRTSPHSTGGKPVDPASLGFRYLERSYFWVMIFNRTRQPLHHYHIEGTESVAGKKALKIRFEPVKPYREKLNDWFGIAWVDSQTFQILHVEAMSAKDHAAFQQLQADRLEAAHAGPVPMPRWVRRIESVSTDFAKVKNGMRFPSRTEIKLTRYTVPTGGRPTRWGDTVVLDRTVQKYTHYLFYGVRAEGQVRDILTGKQKIDRGP
jgi:hypothetical protein